MLSLRWQCPLFAQALRELGLEERGLHAAVNDVPGQHGVVRAIAIDVEIGVETGLREEWTLPPKRQQENAKLLPVIG